MDKTKINKKHRKAFDGLEKSKYATKQQLKDLYDFYVELNKHPEKDWVKIGKEYKK